MKNSHDCKLIVSYEFNKNNKDISTVCISAIDENGMKVLRTLQGENCEGMTDLTEILLENGYKVIKVN